MQSAWRPWRPREAPHCRRPASRWPALARLAWSIGPLAVRSSPARMNCLRSGKFARAGRFSPVAAAPLPAAAPEERWRDPEASDASRLRRPPRKERRRERLRARAKARTCFSRRPVRALADVALPVQAATPTPGDRRRSARRERRRTPSRPRCARRLAERRIVRCSSSADGTTLARFDVAGIDCSVLAATVGAAAPEISSGCGGRSARTGGAFGVAAP